MSVDLSDLVDSLKREVNPPGSSLFPNALNTEYEGHLADAFAELEIYGYISGYVEESGIVTENTATPNPDNDLSKAYQQLIVIVAGMRIIRIALVNIDSLFRAQAGPVEYETRKSALTLNAVLEALQKRFDAIVEGLPDTNAGGTVFYSDMLALRSSPCAEPYSTFFGY